LGTASLLLPFTPLLGETLELIGKPLNTTGPRLVRRTSAWRVAAWLLLTRGRRHALSCWLPLGTAFATGRCLRRS